jgi:hypothetical protein
MTPRVGISITAAVAACNVPFCWLIVRDEHLTPLAIGAFLFVAIVGAMIFHLEEKRDDAAK